MLETKVLGVVTALQEIGSIMASYENLVAFLRVEYLKSIRDETRQMKNMY